MNAYDSTRKAPDCNGVLGRLRHEFGAAERALNNTEWNLAVAITYDYIVGDQGRTDTF